MVLVMPRVYQDIEYLKNAVAEQITVEEDFESCHMLVTLFANVFSVCATFFIINISVIRVTIVLLLKKENDLSNCIMGKVALLLVIYV